MASQARIPTYSRGLLANLARLARNVSKNTVFSELSVFLAKCPPEYSAFLAFLAKTVFLMSQKQWFLGPNGHMVSQWSYGEGHSLAIGP